MTEVASSTRANGHGDQGVTNGGTPRVDLATLVDVRKEMARVYRRMRVGKIKSQDGTRFAYVLSMIGKLIESSDLQSRLEALEQALQQRTN